MIRNPRRQTSSFHKIVVKYKLQVLDVASASAKSHMVGVKVLFDHSHRALSSLHCAQQHLRTPWLGGSSSSAVPRWSKAWSVTLAFQKFPGRWGLTSSTLFSVIYLTTVTCRVCPILCARQIACSSTAGFHWGSTKCTRLATVSVRLSLC